MRRLLALLGLFAWTSAALAGEFELPTLRGTQSFVPAVSAAPRWSGVYVGGQLGYGFGGIDYSNATQSLVAHMLRELALESEQSVSTWPVLGKSNSQSPMYGGFIGYNVGWEGALLGIELSWNKTNFSSVAPVSTLNRVTSAGGNAYDVTLTGSGTMAITSIGTLRARAGWEAGNFLPYGMIGAAFAQAAYSRSATASGTQTDSNNNVVPFTFTEVDGNGSAWLYGVSLGFGVDVMVLPKVFVRAEYEYVAFFQVATIKTTINTARMGIGFKF